MKAILYRKKNPKDKLVYCDVEQPIPKGNEVLIQVHATSVNAADYRMIKMGITPKRKIFGADISGIVESVGANVKQYKPGDEVIGNLSNHGFGGFAEYTVAPENTLTIKPANISFEDAAALPLACTTALQALREKGNIKKGQKVLIVGSSGGVGTCALQLAKYYGAVVTAVCGPRHIEQTKMLGADKVIDYTKEHFSNEKGMYDIVLAVNGDYPLLTYKRCLNQTGKYVLIGGSLSQIFKSLIFAKLLFLGSKQFCMLSAKSNHDNLKTIAELTEKGNIKPIIEKVYPLTETSEAMQHVARGHAKGKVVIKVK